MTSPRSSQPMRECRRGQKCATRRPHVSLTCLPSRHDGGALGCVRNDNFCMGTYEVSGPGTYKLKHVALGWDATGTVFLGQVIIRETVHLGRGGNASPARSA